MTTLAQLALFLSSYAPLFAVFALLDSFGKGWPTAICISLAALGLVLLAGVLVAAKRMAPQSLHVEDVQVRDGDALAYIATYLVPFAAMATATTRERVALLVFVALIALLYVRSELFYTNPFLAILGYKLYQISTPKGTSAVLLSRRRFLGAETQLSARRLSNYVYLEVGE